eukprot:10717183-Ditylum_brightwellii.AAC.1
MVIVGGTSSTLGTGPGSMLCEAWILDLNKEGEEQIYTWMKFDWGTVGVDRCRHSMAAVNDTTIVWWGGYDGEKAAKDGTRIWCVDIKNAGIGKDSSNKDYSLRNTMLVQTDEKRSKLQERWQAEVPVREEDLPPEVLEKAKRSRLPGAVYKAIHRHAVANNKDTYIDPASGYSVFTSTYLDRKPCCGNGCRHCPHGHINVPKKFCDNKDLEW